MQRRAGAGRLRERALRSALRVVVIVGLCTVGPSVSKAQGHASGICDGIPKRETTLLAQVRVVRQAVEQFAAATGAYPANVAELQPYLPGGSLLRNVFTYAPTEPVDAYAANSGEIGYIAVTQEGTYVGYELTAYSKTALIQVLTNLPQDGLRSGRLEERPQPFPPSPLGPPGIRKTDPPQP